MFMVCKGVAPDVVAGMPIRVFLKASGRGLVTEGVGS